MKLKNIILCFIFLIIVLPFAYSDNQTELDLIALAIYDFEETNFNYADDLNGLDFTSGTAPDRIAGINNFGQDFDRTIPEYIYTDKSEDFETNYVGVSFWIDVTSDTASPTSPFNMRTDDTGGGGWDLMIQSETHGTHPRELYIYGYTVGGGAGGYVGKNIRAVDGWQHIVACYDGTNFKTWVDNSAGTSFPINSIMQWNGGTDTRIEIAQRYDGSSWSQPINAIIDEVYYFSDCPSSGNVDWLYNSGVGNFAIDGYFNPSTFNMTLLYPENNSRMNNFTGLIILNSTQVNFNCTLNDSNFVFSDYDTTQIIFNNSGAVADGNYTIEFNCNDTVSSYHTGTIYFEIDTTKPNIYYYYPLNLSRTRLNYSWVNVSVYDNYAIWEINITIKNISNGTMYNNYTTNISIISDVQYFNITEYINMSLWLDGNYTLNVSVYDSHTDNIEKIEIDNIRFYDLDNFYRDLYFNDKPIRFIYPIEYTFNFYDYKTKVVNEIISNDDYGYYFIEGKEKIIYLENSRYPCHLIIDNYFWHDCEGLDKPKVTKINDLKYRIDFNFIFGKALTESTGILNYISQLSQFEIDRTPPTINITYPENGTLYNNTYTGYIYITTDEISNCSLNNSNFTVINSTPYYFSFYNSESITNGTFNYSLLVSCNDSLDNIAQYFLFFDVFNEGDNMVIAEFGVLIMTLIYFFMFVVSLYIKHESGYIITALYGLIFGVYLYNTVSNIPQLISAIFTAFNFVIIIAMILKDKSK